MCVSREGILGDAEEAGYDLVETHAFLPEDKYIYPETQALTSAQHPRAGLNFNHTHTHSLPLTLSPITHTHNCARENGKIEFFNITCGDYEFQITCEGYRNKTFARAGVWARDSYTIIADISVD